MYIALALSITLMVELLVITNFYFKDIRTFLIMSLANMILNVSMNVLSHFMPNLLGYYIFLISFEIATFIIEALILIFICKKKKVIAFLASFIANAASLGVGLLIYYINPDTKTTIVLIVIFAIIYSLALLVNLFFYLLSKNKN